MGALRRSLVVVVVAGLAIDAFIHLRVAGSYDSVGSGVTEGLLFRVEAALALLAMVALLLRLNRITAGFAALVAGGGTFALLLYYFVNVGAIGPLPDMYEHVMFGEKQVTLVAQIVATVAALALVVLGGSTGGEPAEQAAADARHDGTLGVRA